MTPQDLRAWRAGLKITQDVAAKALDVSRRTYGSYEQDDGAIPRTVALACHYLAEHPDELPTLLEAAHAEAGPVVALPGFPMPAATRSLRIPLDNARAAGVVEIAIAAVTVAQETLRRLEQLNMINRQDITEIFKAATATHNDSPAGDQPWTGGTIEYLRAMHQDLVKPRR